MFFVCAALKEQFARYIDTNRDERASKREILAYLRKYNPAVTDQQVTDFIARRDKDGKLRDLVPFATIISYCGSHLTNPAL